MNAEIPTATASLPKFRFDLSELSGAVADLGVMLPLVVALVTLNGVNATSAFFVIGLAYFINAYAYRLPIPVQPLKAMAATALALSLSPEMITAAAWWVAAIFLLLSFTNATRWLAGLFPIAVVRGIQLGLGLLLLRSAWVLITSPGEEWAGNWSMAGFSLPLSWLAVSGSFLVLILGLRWRPSWVGLLVILFGCLFGVAVLGFPQVHMRISWPTPLIPRLGDFWPALWLLVVPQVPLSLANSVFATADAAKKYFGELGEHVSARRLLFTMGLGNVAAAALAGVPICHGSGGLTAHVRLGARTGGALILIGALFIALGLFGGSSLLPLLNLIPFPALGVLLGYVGLQHMWLASDLQGTQAWLVAVMVALITWITQNLAWGFGAGLALHLAWTWTQPLRKPSAGP
ncbi:MAG: putative sulfate/molybdate transporter [Anaerolineales bacterium]